MAIYHLNCSYGSRQGGQSALAKLHYVLREGKYARGRDDLVLSGCGNLPPWCDGDPARLFAAADMYERANGRLYVEAEGALPIELNRQQQDELVRAFMGEFAPGLPYIYGIHAGRPSTGQPRNRHFHCLANERVNDGIRRDPEKWFRRASQRNPSAGGAPKDRSLKGHGWVDETRHRYERLVNEALERAGRPERVTAESHRDRIEHAQALGDHETAQYLLLHPAGVHIGPTASAIERGGPGRPGQPTERGDIARARAAEARRLRAEFEGIISELKDHERAAVAAARDAGVDEELVAAAQSGDPDEVVALDDATEKRREEIRASAWTVGFDDEAIDGIRREAEPERPDLGWGAVVEVAAARRKRTATAESAAGNVGLNIDAIYANAREQDEDPLYFVERVTAAREAEIAAAARAVLLDDDRIAQIRDGAEAKKAGSGWRALVAATAERRQRRDAAESTARKAGLDVDAIYAEGEERNEDALDFLMRATAKRAAQIVKAAREALFDHREIARILREAESKTAGSGLTTVIQATAERRQRLDAAESAARNVGLDVSTVYASGWKRDEDGVEFLERATAKREAEIVGAAREVWLDDAAIGRFYQEAESRKAGCGWGGVVDGTAERRRQKAAAESAARNVELDVEAVYAEAGKRDVDPVDFLRSATANRQEEIVATARAVLLDDEGIARVRGEAESTAPGSGWRAIVEATEKRRKRKLTAESAALDVGLNVDAVYATAGDRREDPVEALERESRVEHERRSQRVKRYETLVDQPGGRDIYVAWLTELDPDWRSGGEPPGELVERVLDLAASDSRLERLTRVIGDAEAASFYHGEVDTGDQVTLRQIDEGLHAAEESMRRRSVAEEQGRDPESAPPAPEANEKLRKLAWKIERAADAAEAALPTTQRNQDRPDYRVPAASNEILDHVADAATNQLYTEIVEEVRGRYDDDERRESEAQYLHHATGIEHARATRSWKASRDRPRPTRHSAEASIRKKHRSAVREAFNVAYDGAAGHGEPGTLTLAERARLARYLSEERLPFTTPYPGNPSHRLFAISDATFGAAETASGTRRVTATIAAIRSRHWYSASGRAESERTYNGNKGAGPEEARDVVIEVVERAWRDVDPMTVQAARRELDRCDSAHRYQGRSKTAQPLSHREPVGPIQTDRPGPRDVPGGSERDRGGGR